MRSSISLAILAAAAGSAPFAAQAPAAVPPAATAPATATAPGAVTYADLASLADGKPLVARVRISSQANVPAQRAPGLAAGYARLYLEAQTMALLSGDGALPEKLRYLVDVPVDAKGRPPKLKKQEMVVFARTVAGRPGELQLVNPRAQLRHSADLEQRLRPILSAFSQTDVPPRISGVRDVLSSVGNLAGESETQIFLNTSDGEPAALTVIRRPGMAPRWGVSWTELVDQSATPAAPGTIAWYRLACGLPSALPAAANLGTDATDRARAAQDYRFVLDQLGPCSRSLS